jgi:hypothetical protein
VGGQSPSRSKSRTIMNKMELAPVRPKGAQKEIVRGAKGEMGV